MKLKCLICHSVLLLKFSVLINSKLLFENKLYQVEFVCFSLIHMIMLMKIEMVRPGNVMHTKKMDTLKLLALHVVQHAHL